MARRWRVALLLVAAVLSGLVGLPARAQAESRASPALSVRQVRLDGLFWALAHLQGHNLLLISDPQQRLTVALPAAEPAALWAGLVQAAGLVSRPARSVLLLSPEPCQPQPVGPLPPLSNDKLSAEYQSVEPWEVMAALARQHGWPHVRGAVNPTQPVRLITLRLKDVPASEIYQLLASTTGTRLLRQADGAYRIEDPVGPLCGVAPTPAGVARDRAERHARVPRDSCPRRDSDIANGIRPLLPCRQLEYFKTDDLQLRGWLKRAGATLALFEAPDLTTHVAGVGSPLGHHFGRVIAILPEQGLRVQELRLDENDTYQLRRTLIDWADRRHPEALPAN